MKFWPFSSNKEERNISQAETTGSVYSDALLFNPYALSNNSAQSLSAVYRATEIISDSIASLPIEVLNNKNKEVNNHINRLFKQRDYCGLTKYNFFKMLIQSVILNGAGYAYIYRENGVPVKLKYIPKTDVQIFYNEQYEMQYYTCDKIKHGKILPQDMIHLIKNTKDGVNGQSVIQFAHRSLNIAYQSEACAKNYFDNGGSLSGILTVQGQISEKQRDQIKAAWNQTYTTGNGGIAVLQGNMSYQPVQVGAKDVQLLESRQWNVEDIARFFSIDPVMLGCHTGNSYNTVEAVQQQFVFLTLAPYIQMVEEEFTRKLCGDNCRISLNENYFLRSDKQSEATYYTSLVNAGLITPDEAREALGYEPMGLNDLIIPYTKVSDNKINSDNLIDNKEDNSDIENSVTDDK